MTDPLKNLIALWPLLVAAWLLAESDYECYSAKVALQKSGSWRMIAIVAIGCIVLWQLPYAITYAANLDARTFAEQLFLGCFGYVGVALLGNLSLASRRRFEGAVVIKT